MQFNVIPWSPFCDGLTPLQGRYSHSILNYPIDLFHVKIFAKLMLNIKYSTSNKFLTHLDVDF